MENSNIELKNKFSKEHTRNERNELAHEIQKRRKKYSPSWKSWNKNQAELDDANLNEQHEHLRKDFIGRLFKTREFLNKETLWKSIIQEKRGQEIDRLRKKFDEKIKKITEQSPLSSEEQEKYLSEEALIKMNLDDYLFLLNRLSGYFVSHVTRYGVREQTFQSTGGGHRASEGKFIDNFTDILKGKKLNSFFTNLIDKTDYAKQAIKNTIQVLQKHNPNINRDEVIETIWEQLRSDTDPFAARRPDKSSFHVGGNAVLSQYYGTEYGYDFYFYFPAEAIAKNYYHSGPDDLTGGEDQGWYNDYMIWNKGRGIPIEAGITCISGNKKVDKNTGSQYKLDKEGKPETDPRIANHIEFVENKKDILIGWFSKIQKKIKNCYGKTTPEIEQEIKEMKVQAAKELRFDNVEIFNQFYDQQYYEMNPNIERFYQRNGLYYMRPNQEDVVTSKEFWEKYFEQHPDEKPNKLLYYDFSTWGKRDKQAELGKLSQKTLKQDITETPEYEYYIKQTAPLLKEAISEIYDELSASEKSTN